MGHKQEKELKLVDAKRSDVRKMKDTIYRLYCTSGRRHLRLRKAPVYIKQTTPCMPS